MRRSRVTGGTARSMAVATIRTVRWIVVDSPGSRVLRTAMAADMGSVLKLDNSLKSSSHRLEISIEDYPPSLRQHHRVMSTIPTPRERKLADTSSLAVWDISSDPVRYQINTRVSRRITPPPPTPPPPTPPRSD